MRGADGAVRDAEAAVRDAVAELKRLTQKVEKWVEKEGFTGEEPSYKALKILQDGARATLDTARAFFLDLNGAGKTPKHW